MIEYTHKTDRDEVKSFGDRFGLHYESAVKARGLNHVCSDLILINCIRCLLEAVDQLSGSFDEILSDKNLLGKWVATRPACEFLVTAIPKWVDLDLSTTIGHELVSDRHVDAQIQSITADLYLFCLWAIWYGADTRSKAIFINNKATKVLQAAIKKNGHDWILNRAWCSCLAFVCLSDKAIEPRLQKVIRCQEDRSVNALPTKRKAEPQNSGCISGFGGLKEFIDEHGGCR